MLADGLGHGRRLTAAQGVDPAHDPLQRGDLHDHGGGQIGLAEHGRARGEGFVFVSEVKKIGYGRCELLQPADLVQHRAQTFLEGQRRQPLVERLQWTPAVVPHEVDGVGVAGPDDRLVAAGHQLRIAVGAIGHGDEVGQHPAGLAHHGEVALLLLHHGDQHRLGDGKVGRVEAAQQRQWLFDQVGDFLQQRFIVRHTTADRGRQALDTREDLPLALLLIEHHAGVGDGLAVRGGGSDGDRRRAVRPHTAADAPTEHVGVLEGHHLIAVQRHQPAQGTAEANVTAVPTHGLAEAQPRHQVPQQVGKQEMGRIALHPPDGVDVAPSTLFPHFQVGHGHTFTAGEAFGGFGRLAIGVEGSLRRRPAELLRLGGLLGDQVLHMQDDAPRRAADGNALVPQPGLGQSGVRCFLQLGNAIAQVAGGQFLDANLQQQVSGGLGDGRWCGHRRPLTAQGQHVVRQERKLQPPPLLHVGFGHRAGHVPHAAEVVGPLGDPHRPAGVQDVESVGALEDVVVGGDNQPALDGCPALRLVQVVHQLHPLHVSHVEGVFAVLDFGRLQHVAVAVPVIPPQVPHFLHILQEHGDALQPVGEFHGDGIEVQTARLLEVGELGDLQPIQPHLPAQAPCAQRRALPVVLHETHVVGLQINAHGPQALQVQLLRVAGVRFEDDLVLSVHLHAVGILGETAVVGPVGRLHVAHVPGLGAQHAQRGGRIGRARAQLLAVGLPDQAALVGPEAFQPHDHLLEGQCFVRHFRLSSLCSDLQVSFSAPNCQAHVRLIQQATEA